LEQNTSLPLDPDLRQAVLPRRGQTGSINVLCLCNFGFICLCSKSIKENKGQEYTIIMGRRHLFLHYKENLVLRGVQTVASRNDCV